MRSPYVLSMRLRHGVLALNPNELLSISTMLSISPCSIAGEDMHFVHKYDRLYREEFDR